MENILFVIPAFYEDRPQSIRFRHILEHGRYNNIYVLTNSNSSYYEKYSLNNAVTIINYKSSKFGAYINKFYYPNGIVKPNIFLRSFLKGIRYILKKVFFPDLFIIELDSIKKEIKNITEEIKVEKIVLSVAPHSLLPLSEFIKNNSSTTNAMVVLDVGDPLYNNSVRSRNKSRNEKALKFERRFFKYVDILVVTNLETKIHYQKLYNKFFPQLKIEMVPMGGDKQLITNVKNQFLQKKDNYVFTYAGIFYKILRSPDKLFMALELFNGKNSITIDMDIYGHGLDYYSKKVKKISMKNIHFHNPMKHSNISKIYEQSDVLVHIDNAYGLQTPGKNYELFLTNKPILFIYTREDTTAYNLFYGKPGVFMTKNCTEDIYEILKEITSKDYTFNRLNEHSLFEMSWENRSETFFKLI